MLRSPSPLAGSIARVHVGEHERTDRVDLHDRLSARHRMVRMVGGAADELVAAERLHLRLLELRAHAGEERSGENGYVLHRRMRVRRELVPVGKAQAYGERLGLAGIA